MRVRESAAWIREWAADLALVVGLVLVAWVVLLVPGVPWPVRWAFGIPFILVLPGYALVAALFPEAPADSANAPFAVDGGPDWTVRIALSLALSAVVLAVVGVLLSETVGLRLVPVVLAIGALTIASAEVAAGRRLRRAPADRASPLSGGVRSSVGGVFGGTTLQTATTVVAVVALVGVLVYAGMAPTKGESYSEFYVLTEDENGDLVAEGYPTTFVAGEGHDLYVGIENHERRTVSYNVVILAESVDANGTVTDRREIDRFGVERDAGEQATVRRTVAPQRTGDNVRLRFLLYEGPVPENPGPGSADLSTHLWVEVVEGDGG